eukprot:Tamp_42120.p1 GENE.Tamp_42120~~Tamp_42120.p1  ORF type:complete len:113 (-),score=7.39 Tamp_42120:46-384(-)
MHGAAESVCVVCKQTCRAQLLLKLSLRGRLGKGTASSVTGAAAAKNKNKLRSGLLKGAHVNKSRKNMAASAMPATLLPAIPVTREDTVDVQRWKSTHAHAVKCTHAISWARA